MQHEVLSLSLYCCRAEHGTDCFAQMKLVFTADVHGSSKQVPLVYVRWLTARGQSGALPMQRQELSSPPLGRLRLQGTKLAKSYRDTRGRSVPWQHFAPAQNWLSRCVHRSTLTGDVY